MRRSWKAVLGTGLLILAGAGLAACGNTTEMEDREARASGREVIPLEGDAAFTLVVSNEVGEISVRAGDAGEVVVDYTQIAYAPTEADARSELADMRLSMRREGAQVIVDGTQPGDSAGRRNEIELSITVPAGMDVRITNGVGNITLAGLRPQTSLEIVNEVGEIAIDDVQMAGGALVVSNQVGKVVVSDTMAAAGLSLTTDTGEISFGGALGTTGEYAITTDVGRITVRLTPDASVRFDAATNTGRITIEGLELDNLRETTDDSGKALTGTLGDGAITLKLRANVGHITLRQD